MRKLIMRLFSPPSLRLNKVVICGVVLLLAVSLGVMFYFSNEALHKEVRLDAEQTLEGAMQQVDNILRGVEQSASNVYGELTAHLGQPERMNTYSRKLVECNPDIVGCAICFKPNYYPGHKLFMTYTRQTDDVESQWVSQDRYGNGPYIEYEWYKAAIDNGKTCWYDPQQGGGDEGASLLFSQPIENRNGERVGVMMVELSVDQLSQLVLSDKSADYMYSVLLGSDGSFIVNPFLEERKSQSVFKLAEEDPGSTLLEVAQAMMAGEAGYMPFRIHGYDRYAFYKPFLQNQTPNRLVETPNWSIAIVYSEDDVIGGFYKQLSYAIVLSLVGLLVFYLLVRVVTRRQMKPLRQLTYTTQRIAEGHYDEPIPDIQRDDEIGLLHDHFQLMEQSLAAHVKELDMLKRTLKSRREVMNEVYAKDQSVDRVKTSFLHYVTNQMVAPANDIAHYVNTLCDNFRKFSPKEIDIVVGSINSKSKAIFELISNMLDTADEEALNTSDKRETERKEASHE